MNFSDYTLVSFGDSFTAGAGLAEPPEFDRGGLSTIREEPNTSEISEFYAKTRDAGYTAILSNILKFKDYYNFGMEGGSNERTLQLLNDWIYSIDTTENYFVIVNLTQIQRKLFFSEQVDDHGNTWVHDLDFNAFTEERLKWLKKDSWHISNISPKGIQEYYTYIETNTKLFYNFVETFYSIKTLLESKNIPYIIFDVMCDIQRYGPMVKPVTIRPLPHKYAAATNRKYNDRYQPFLSGDISEFKYYMPKSFVYDIIGRKYNPKNKKYSENAVCNMFRTIDVIGNLMEDNYRSDIPGDQHWNVKGHKICTDILKEFIMEQYK